MNYFVARASQHGRLAVGCEMLFNFVHMVGHVELQWKTEGDNWLFLVQQEITEELSGSGYSIQHAGSHIALQISVNNEYCDDMLLIVPLNDDRVAFGVGSSKQEPDGESILRWQRAVAKANAEKGERLPTYKWTALISEIPSWWGGTVGLLAKPFRIDGLQISSTEKYLYERSPLPVPTLSSYKIRISMPLLIRGVTEGVDWMRAEPAAAEKINALTDLLTLSWGRSMVVREMARPVEMGDCWVPNSPLGIASDTPMPDLSEAQKVTLDVPEWFEKAWFKIKKEAKLRSAVSIHSEGLRIEGAHPSFALVAYISAIEAISLKVFEVHRCGECKNYMGIGARFAETLKLVMSTQEAESLKKAYEMRSHTVHRGSLHGSELNAGVGPVGIFVNPPEREFASLVRRMGSAARSLLILAVRGDLPKRARIDAQRAS
ncbi:hypothetical protein ACWCPT_06870 [Streptomyces sp. NPDC002308]